MQLRLAPARRPGTAAARPAPLARPPAAKPTKAADFRSLPDADIDASVAESKRALFDMRIAQRTRQEFKPSDFGWHKKKIAQLLTVKRERTLAAGVTKREARKAEKAEKVAAGFGQF